MLGHCHRQKKKTSKKSHHFILSFKFPWLRSFSDIYCCFYSSSVNCLLRVSVRFSIESNFQLIWRRLCLWSSAPLSLRHIINISCSPPFSCSFLSACELLRFSWVASGVFSFHGKPLPAPSTQHFPSFLMFSLFVTCVIFGAFRTLVGVKQGAIAGAGLGQLGDWPPPPLPRWSGAPGPHRSCRPWTRRRG